MKVLVLDSGATVRRIISSFFPSEDFQIVEAATAKEGLDLAFQESFDLITIGMILPDADGFNVCKIIRTSFRDKKSSACKNSKIYLITSGDIESNRDKAKEFGFDGIYPKPLGIEEFKAVIEEIIELAYGKEDSNQLHPNHHKKIVIVDDSELNLLLLGKILKKNGFQVQAFTEGKKALEFLLSSDFEISHIFTDWIMPDFSGEEFVEAIRKQNRFDSVPIAVITGLEENEGISRSKLPINVRILHKPYSERSILEYIQKN
ncbi:response regulator [Leptospira sp. 201903070]|uniref:Response regulator n=1 Tax=Leptospira ainlahdjerensis TaxID=2810033 RepID=A0ABS2UB13_9LEPT|nr:response regulator [Leptospira ainlahdjerensis]MBM9577552.1 response regulator [Leptospira ainlahdjerensis]